MEPTHPPIPQISCNFSTSSSATREDKLQASELSSPSQRNCDPDSLSAALSSADDSKAEFPPSTTAADSNPEQPSTTATDAESEDGKTISSTADTDPNLHSDIPSLSEGIYQFLTNLRGSPEVAPELPDVVIERFTSLVEKNIVKYYDYTTDQHRLPTFLDSVDLASKLSAALTPFSSFPKYFLAISQTGVVVHHAMTFLESDFHSLLLSPFSPQLPSLLRSIATSMISSGYKTECTQIFIIARHNAMEADLTDQGFELLSIHDVHRMTWESLETGIASWTKAFRHAITASFPLERELCDEVFGAHRDIVEDVFRRLGRRFLAQLLNFPEAVAMMKRSSEKLFKVLDMYEALSDMTPKLEDMFPPMENLDLHVEQLAEMSSVRERLGEVAVGIFCDLESSIRSDTGKTPMPDGAVHPLTRLIMNYLKRAITYRNTLEQVFRDHQKLNRSTSESYDDEDGVDSNARCSGLPEDDRGEIGSSSVEGCSSPFSKKLVEVMDLLHSNVEAKARLYKDQALRNIFMMNNGRFLVQKTKESAEINQLLGDTWCRKKSSDLRQYHKKYQRETWSKVLGCLKDEGLLVKGSVVKPVLKDRFKSFNAMLEEIHKTQSAWLVSDEQLQSELRVSIAAVVVPAYRSFLGRFGQYLHPGRQTEKYVKFGPEDLETYVDELFEGNAAVRIKRK